jgi:GT2 family glycosyltransferase
MMKKEFPFVRVIESDKNLGFSKGINLGAKHAKGEFLLFLNSDCQFLQTNLAHMVSFLNNHSDIGIVGGKMVNTDGSLQRSYSNFYGIKDIAVMLFGREKIELLMQKSDSECETDWVSGGFMLVRADVFNRIKGFDERIFMYTEDMELCFRVKKAGYKIYFFPETTVQHEGQGSSNRSFAVINIYKGLKYFYKKHKSFPSYTLILCLLLIKAAGAIIIGIVTGNKKLVSTYMQALTS